MNEYEVTITETLKRKIEIEAESAEEAQRMVKDGWENGDYILLPDDFSDVNFSTKEIGNQKIKVVLLEPGKIARTAEIGTSLKNLQEIVDGYIETAHFFDEPVCLVCNEEGKVRELPINRGIYDKTRNLLMLLSEQLLSVTAPAKNSEAYPMNRLRNTLKNLCIRKNSILTAMKL